MKKLLMACMMIVLLVSCSKESLPANSSNASASNTEDNNILPPQAVVNAFVLHFGNLAVTQWKWRSDNTYTAHFIKNMVSWEATFKTDGSLIKSEASK